MNIIQPEELKQILRVRDMGIARVDAATQTRKKQLNAKTDEEYNNILIPRLYPFNSESVFVDCVQSKQEERKFDEDFLLDMYCRGYTENINGYIVSRYGNLGAVALSDLYRGEIRDYGNQCTSTLGRNIKSQKLEDKFIEFFVGQMRIFCFFSFLTLFRQFTDFRIGTPMAHIIAQHYGLHTQFLDLTDDVKVALFFACCKHIGNNKYRPIDKNDLSEIGEYAVLYHGIEDKTTQIIGYQPFTRCYKQRGYFIDTASSIPCWSYSLTNTRSFTKSLFKRTPELSKRIFEEFDEGNALFPKDSLFYFDEEISQIMKTNRFPEQAFCQTYDIFAAYLETYKNNNSIDETILTLITKDWIRERLVDRKIEFNDRMELHSGKTDIVEELNRKWNPVQYKIDEDIIAWGRETIRYEDGFYISKGRSGIHMIDIE